MDFVDGLPRSRKGNTGIWVMVDRLTKSAHFIPVKSKRTAPWLASVYLREIVRLHRVPSSIVSDRDPIFTREFLEEFTRGGRDSVVFEYRISSSDGRPDREGESYFRRPFEAMYLGFWRYMGRTSSFGGVRIQ